MAVKGLRLEMNSEGVRACLSDPRVEADLLARAEAIASAAGPGFEASSKIAGGSSRLGRAMAYVNPTTPDAHRAESEDFALTRAVGAGRG